MGLTTTCERCGQPLRVADQRNPDARMLRYAQAPEGHCVNCAVAAWFVELELRRLVPDPAALRLPHVQQQFVAVMRANQADAQPEEIDWEHVIKNWDLPFKKRSSQAAGQLGLF